MTAYIFLGLWCALPFALSLMYWREHFGSNSGRNPPTVVHRTRKRLFSFSK